MDIMGGIKNLVGQVGQMGRKMLGMGEPKGSTPAASPGGDSQALGPLSPDQLKLWKNRIKRAQAHHKVYWSRADDIKAEYLGPCDARFQVEVEREGKPVNLVASFVNTVGPQILPGSPWPIVEQQKPGEQYRQGAKLLEARQRGVFDRPASYVHLRRAVFDAFFLAGFALTGWEANRSRKVVAASADTQTQADTLPAQDSEGGLSSAADEPFVRHIPYRDMIIDPDSILFEDARWCGYRTFKRPLDLRANPLNNVPEELQGSVRTDGDDDERDVDDVQRDKADAVVTVWTIFSRGRSKGEVEVIVLAGPKHIEIRHEYVQMGTPGFPIQCLTYHDVGRLFPASPEQFWLDLSDSFNEFVAEMTERASQAKTVTVVPDIAARDSIVNAAGGTVIVHPQSDMIHSEQIGGTSPETWTAMQAFERLTDKISSLSDFQRGVGGAGGRTATEVSMMQQFTQTRLGDMQGAANRFLRSIAADMGGLLLTHQWDDVTVKLNNGGGNVEYATFNNSVVPAEPDAYGYDFDVSDHTRINPAVRQKRAQDRLALLADPNLQQLAANEGFQISVVECLRDLLETSGERDMERYLKKLPTPQELAAAQVQDAQD